MVSIIYIIIPVLTLMICFSNLVAKPNHDILKDDHLEDHAAHDMMKHQILQQRLKLSRNADIYSCRIDRLFSQCRQYRIPNDVTFKVKDLSVSCQSMLSGSFVKSSCPNQRPRLGRCQQILRNYHDKKSLVYENHYYGGQGSPWTIKKIKRVCRDLEGKFAQVATIIAKRK